MFVKFTESMYQADTDTYVDVRQIGVNMERVLFVLPVADESRCSLFISQENQVTVKSSVDGVLSIMANLK
ncbi:hypothetical protein BH10CYA1_BH10CYA1_04300 [soil metagenome]